MTDVHIFAYPWQPFTRFDCAGVRFNISPRTLYRCEECGDKRQARNLEIQAYYDHWRVRCKDAKHPGWN